MTAQRLSTSEVEALAAKLHEERCWRSQCPLYGPEDVFVARALLTKCEECGKGFTYDQWLDRHDSEDGPVHSLCCVPCNATVRDEPAEIRDNLAFYPASQFEETHTGEDR